MQNQLTLQIIDRPLEGDELIAALVDAVTHLEHDELPSLAEAIRILAQRSGITHPALQSTQPIRVESKIYVLDAVRLAKSRANARK